MWLLRRNAYVYTCDINLSIWLMLFAEVFFHLHDGCLEYAMRKRKGDPRTVRGSCQYMGLHEANMSWSWTHSDITDWGSRAIVPSFYPAIAISDIIYETKAGITLCRQLDRLPPFPQNEMYIYPIQRQSIRKQAGSFSEHSHIIHVTIHAFAWFDSTTKRTYFIKFLLQYLLIRRMLNHAHDMHVTYGIQTSFTHLNTW